ncbi:aminotransferase class I/II-fold pyridoxal phosphate-dependent enzyme [Paragemmobacter straminiformis]|uniref:Aminotransferase n=1 Tax=Paragemmobacter straminiformis TaxID=2045119 RepID=A0A842ID35_9RHOB|nr:aminotransferase class I/II-fold pyridoxal phosphate-dependent enzyme [Gemmobacter straminiformis]MBC2837511.1 aminotransferase class I/II-fold pyridoxal phosphate-dependent enzyme [Gemmobacter straminiformis]
MAGVDHGGGIDAAAARWGGARGDWLDLSTGINPRPYPLPAFGGDIWTALPDRAAFAEAEAAARSFWRVPDGAAVLAAPGASALIARLPALRPAGRVSIAGPTYNEHARAFAANGWQVVEGAADAAVVVHPNNPDGRFQAAPDAAFSVIDESFCDICPDESQIAQAGQAGTVVLKSFGKFWGLAGMRLGFAIGDPVLLARLEPMIGPWAVSGPALVTAAKALRDEAWAAATRARLAADAARLDALMLRAGVSQAGGTALFRLYDVGDAAAWQERLARHRILGRIFPYSARWLRLGLPDGDGWARLEAAL